MTPPDVSDLLLIRHAPADHGGRLCGRRDVAALLPEPKTLMPLRQWLSGCTRVVTSPALRCRQTAEALFPGRDMPSDPRLWEQDFGEHDGMAFTDIPDIGNLSQDDLAAYAPPGGESFDAMAARVGPALAALTSGPKDHGPIAIVAHAGTVRAALGIATGHVPKGLGFEVAPLSVTWLRRREGGLSIIATNWEGPRA